MTIFSELFEELKSKGISLNLDENNNLKVRGKVTNLTQDVTEKLKAHKLELVEWIKDQRQKAEVSELFKSNIPIASRDQVNYICSFSQQRMWLLDKLNEGSSEYNMPATFKLVGDINSNILERAFAQLISCHEILRTTYSKPDFEVRQCVKAEFTLPYTFLDLSNQSEDKINKRLNSLVEKHASHVFDLENEMPVNLTLIKIGLNEYAFLFNIHHIAADGLSRDLLIDQLIETYYLLEKNENYQVPNQRIQYLDYASWQRSWLTQEKLDRQISYWRERLKGVPEVHSMPLDKKRPAKQDLTGASLNVTVPNKLAAKILDFCKKNEFTLFHFMQTAFSIGLHFFGRQEDIVLGAPLAGREHPDLGEMIGFFMNTLVLRCNIRKDSTLIDLIRENKRNLLEAYQNQDVSFEMIVDALSVNRSNQYNPLTQIFLNVSEINQTISRSEGSRSDIQVLPLYNESAAEWSKADMTLYCNLINDRMTFDWSFRKSLFNESSIQSLSNLVVMIAEQLCDNSDAKISNLKLLSDSNKNAIKELYGPKKLTKSFISIAQLIDEVALAQPDKVAVRHKQQKIAFGDLKKRTDQFAKNLREYHQIENNDVVAICMERGIDLVIALIGILKAGAAYCPIDPDFPNDRIQYILSNSKAKLLLTSLKYSYLKDSMSSYRLFDDLLKLESSSQLPRISEDNLSHIIYTSGSTGNPKGVKGTHKSMYNRVDWMTKEFPFSSNERCCFITSYNFIRSVWEVFLPLTAGVEMLIVDTEAVKHADTFVDLIAEYSISRIVTAPSLARKMLLLNRDKLKSLKYWFISGEPLSNSLTNNITDSLENISLVNLYGATETMSDVTYNLVPSQCEKQTVPIGKSIQNNLVLILDENFNFLPVGVAGEIFVSGDNVAQGYIGMPELTSERFLYAPKESDAYSLSHQLFYKTGDVGRLLESGDIEFIGRVDHQVKIRGFRIELGEVEYNLKRIKYIEQAVAHICGEGDGKKIVASVLIENRNNSRYSNENELNQLKQTILAELKALVPEYMVPTKLMVYQEFPLLPNGKIDRKRLEKESENALANHQVIQPKTKVEKIIGDIWRAVLKIDNLSVTDDFYALGGNSLLLIEVFSKCKAHGLKVTIKQLAMYRTVESLAKIVDKRTVVKTTDSKCLVPLNNSKSQSNVFCIHPIGGTVACYQALAEYLETDAKVIGMQCRDIFTDFKMGSFVDLAKYYVEEILTVQSEGPFHIIGWSLGGKIAYEVASQLEKQGKKIGFVGLLDARSFTDQLSEEAPWYLPISRLHSEAELKVSWDYLSQFNQDDGIEVLSSLLVKSGDILEGIDAGLISNYFHYLSNLDIALSEYVPRTSDFDFVLFRVEQNEHQINYLNSLSFDERAKFENHGWSYLAQGHLKVIDVDGTHATMLSPPHFDSLSEKILILLKEKL